jgi:hypothetical protein
MLSTSQKGSEILFIAKKMIGITGMIEKIKKNLKNDNST